MIRLAVRGARITADLKQTSALRQPAPAQSKCVATSPTRRRDDDGPSPGAVRPVVRLRVNGSRLSRPQVHEQRQYHDDSHRCSICRRAAAQNGY